MAASASPTTRPRETTPLPRAADTLDSPVGARHSPMDLVCRRTVRESADGADSALGFDYRYIVSLPNPRHPQAAAAVIRHHCSDDITSSMAWGYAGAEPSDVALNVMAAYFPCHVGIAASEVFRARDGSLVSARAEQLHQAFKLEFVRRLPTAGGVITEAQVRSWLAVQEALGQAA